MKVMRPWTRMECARLVQEAADQIGDNQSTGNEANQLYGTLAKEFAKEIDLLGGGNNRDAELESSLHARDGHFGRAAAGRFRFRPNDHQR